jgi:hypothetical protein
MMSTKRKTTIKVGDTIPAFVLESQDGKRIPGLLNGDAHVEKTLEFLNS